VLPEIEKCFWNDGRRRKRKKENKKRKGKRG
jgi:hypothetical protein